jgi:hypothetical protein
MDTIAARLDAVIGQDRYRLPRRTPQTVELLPMHRESQQEIEKEKQQRRTTKNNLHGGGSFGQPAYQNAGSFAPGVNPLS